MTVSRVPIYMALVHYPVMNRKGDQIATAITNLDVHDGSRMAATFGLGKYFLVSPIDEQQSLVIRITSHWVTGPGAQKNPKRKLAMSKAHPATDLQAAYDSIKEETGRDPLLVGTSAQRWDSQHISYQDLRQRIHQPEVDDTPILLVFGTGWGLCTDITPSIQLMLPPITGGTDYNHLSVRAAMAIILDRLLGIQDV